MRVENAVNIADLEALARRRLPKVIFDFMDGGAEDEVTLRGNREGFERYRFRPRLLTGNAKRDLLRRRSAECGVPGVTVCSRATTFSLITISCGWCRSATSHP